MELARGEEEAGRWDLLFNGHRISVWDGKGMWMAMGVVTQHCESTSELFT